MVTYMKIIYKRLVAKFLVIWKPITFVSLSGQNRFKELCNVCLLVAGNDIVK